MEEIWKNRTDDTLPCEQWKLINGCSNYYVSSLGRVKTSDRYSSRKRKNRKDDVVFVKGKILKQSENKDGYLRCCIIYDNGNKKSVYVHRLVIKTFLGDSTLPQINHIDKISTIIVLKISNGVMLNITQTMVTEIQKYLITNIVTQK